MSDVCPGCKRVYSITRKRVKGFAGRDVCSECNARTTAQATGMLMTPDDRFTGMIIGDTWFKTQQKKRAATRAARLAKADPASVPPQDQTQR